MKPPRRSPARSKLLQAQRIWAEQSGSIVDERGYVGDIGINLRAPLSPRALQAFTYGSGAELKDGKRRPAKMKALHSSAALAVNFFDYWTNRDAAPLAAALSCDSGINRIDFEVQFATGLEGNPPNLDVAITDSAVHIVGIESKFCEWLTPKLAGSKRFKEKYFSSADGVWVKNGLPQCQALAEALRTDRISFRYLDAPQLLKHALGMATQLGTRFSLWYLFFDFDADPAGEHSNEISDFSRSVAPELNFRAMTYQQLFKRLEASAKPEDSTYLLYLRSRYFPD